MGGAKEICAIHEKISHVCISLNNLKSRALSFAEGSLNLIRYNVFPNKLQFKYSFSILGGGVSKAILIMLILGVQNLSEPAYIILERSLRDCQECNNSIL